MNQKQNWLLKRLLLPVGFIPKTVNISDFKTYEQTRQRLSSRGFEYFYMMMQNAEDVNQSALKGKIFAMHAPWNNFPPIASLPEPIRSAADFLILRNRHFPSDIVEKTRLALEFAQKIGASVIVSHISFFDHHKLPEQLRSLAGLEQKYKIPIAIEHDAPYIYDWIKRGDHYLKFDGSYDWMISPTKMSLALKKLLPSYQFGICFDSASLIMASLPLVETIKPIVKQVIHVHLASNNPGTKDEAREIDSPDIVDLTKYLFASNYSGLITAEVGGAIGAKEDWLAKAHTALAIIGINSLRSTVLLNAQSHLLNSCNYLLDSLK